MHYSHGFAKGKSCGSGSGSTTFPHPHPRPLSLYFSSLLVELTYLSIVCEKNVLSLDVPVYDLAGVQVGQPAQHLSTYRGKNSNIYYE